MTESIYRSSADAYGDVPHDITDIRGVGGGVPQIIREPPLVPELAVSNMSFRHGYATNGLFWDGHAETLSIDMIFEPSLNGTNPSCIWDAR